MIKKSQLKAMWPGIQQKLQNPPPGHDLGGFKMPPVDKIIFDDQALAENPSAIAYVSTADADNNGVLDSLHIVVPRMEQALRERGITNPQDVEGEKLHSLLSAFVEVFSHEMAHMPVGGKIPEIGEPLRPEGYAHSEGEAAARRVKYTPQPLAATNIQNKIEKLGSFRMKKIKEVLMSLGNDLDSRGNEKLANEVDGILEKLSMDAGDQSKEVVPHPNASPLMTDEEDDSMREEYYRQLSPDYVETKEVDGVYPSHHTGVQGTSGDLVPPGEYARPPTPDGRGDPYTYIVGEDQSVRWSLDGNSGALTTHDANKVLSWIRAKKYQKNLHLTDQQEANKGYGRNERQHKRDMNIFKEDLKKDMDSFKFDKDSAEIIKTLKTLGDSLDSRGEIKLADQVDNILRKMAQYDPSLSEVLPGTGKIVSELAEKASTRPPIDLSEEIESEVGEVRPPIDLSKTMDIARRENELMPEGQNFWERPEDQMGQGVGGAFTDDLGMEAGPDNSNVKAIQNQLQVMDYLDQADGLWGPKSQEAWMRFLSDVNENMEPNESGPYLERLSSGDVNAVTSSMKYLAEKMGWDLMSGIQSSPDLDAGMSPSEVAGLGGERTEETASPWDPVAEADDDLLAATSKKVEEGIVKEASNLEHMFSLPADGGPFGRN